MSKPVAWAVFYCGNALYFTDDSRRADSWRDAGATVTPLYTKPTLTDEEREAIAKGICLCEGTAGEANENINAHEWARVASLLRGLLDRAEEKA
jgi:hypothetical protein